MIYLAFGSNLKSKFGCCSFVINKAYGELEKFGIRILCKSSFYKSKAYPNPKDPEFVNSVILVNSEIHVTKLLNIILKRNIILINFKGVFWFYSCIWKNILSKICIHTRLKFTTKTFF